MDEKKRTITYGGVAIGLALIAFIVNIPRTSTPEAFYDQGELFFPEFTDPNEAQTLEVIDYNEETGTPIPFKVTFQDGIWTIPSHHNYPADAEDRLAETAAGVIQVRKDDFRSDNVADHEAFGVIDPLDEANTSLKGRGKRVTIKGTNDKILADFIIGEKVEGRDNFRFVRIPGQKRVYASRVDIDLSTKFSDWIDSDVLKVDKSAITEVILRDYSINERTGVINQRDVIELNKEGAEWAANKMGADEEVDEDQMDDLLKAVDELSIVGVRPKPEGLSQSLTKDSDSMSLSQSDVLSLQSKGYYFTRDGQLVSNEGELQVRTKDGVIYTLRFGEIVSGSGLALTAGTKSGDEDGVESDGEDDKENRYLFITTEFDPSQFPEPSEPKNTEFQTKADSLWTDADRRNKELFDEHEEWKEKVEKGKNLSQELNARFAKWYYVISSGSFDDIHVTRGDLIKKKEEDS
ncbi:DUF4340 domain-containing protein [candidate division KSB1 bacterium]|nr:DUF4340 domain-containing protein [candidate division KSB1 bacterium]NIR69032.1 DUF4340 domain-containing protein [candidate division KSB1 bacterium]NIS24098.1 DUF4340 domain-containing protein [candidate division KSB1 bacterium]NIT71017.1 DUF4340 domain-containing protein [candidate division KSB1 bacterium]NIU24717.1 DUF4340 domain-containing protein [candidate division KSB1 bacterium]